MRKDTAKLPLSKRDKKVLATLRVVDLELKQKRAGHLESKLPKLSPVEGRELDRLYAFLRLHA